MDPERRQQILDALAVQREGSLASFFTAHDLLDAFESPGRGWGREKKIAAALAVARKQGRESEVLEAASARFRATAKPIVIAEHQTPGAAVSTGADPRGPLIFISHVGTEQEIALALKAGLQEAFPDLEIFVSSDPGSISPGERWLDAITAALGISALQIVIASPASVGRPWINFEAGAQWIRPIPVIPMCHSGMTPSLLPLPLTLLQGGFVTKTADLENCFRAVGRVSRQRPQKVDYLGIGERLREIEARYLADGTSTLPPPSTPVTNRTVPDLRALSTDRRMLERDLFDRILELQTLRAEGLRPSDQTRLTSAIRAIGQFWTEPSSLSDAEVANAIEELAAVIQDMRSAKPVDLERKVLEAMYAHDIEQAAESVIRPVDLDSLAQQLGVSRVAVRRRVQDLIAAGLAEGYLETFGESAADGHARLTDAGREEIEDQG